jgi:hypothetical protein
LSARNKRIEPAALANLSCANDIPFESILRQNDVQNRFHTASTHKRHLQYGSVEQPASYAVRVKADQLPVSMPYLLTFIIAHSVLGDLIPTKGPLTKGAP